MRIKFLGTGSAFTLKNFQSNIGIQENGKWLILDAGSDIRFSLKKAGLGCKDIDSIYISHLHADHAGGLEFIGFSTYFDPSKHRIQLYGNGELLRRGWEDTWKGGLESIQGKLMSLDDFFDVHPIEPNGSFVWEGIQFNIIQAIHVMNGYSVVPCYGLMMKPKMSPSKTIFWTSDSQHCPSQLLDFYKQADLIIQDCETTNFKSGVHASFSELVSLPQEIKSKMILIHYQDNIMDDSGRVVDEWIGKAIGAGFKGFAAQGNELDIGSLLKQ
jgi:ribonuclease BN (tRNA processing enzyme)